MRTITTDVSIVQQMAFCEDCLWVDRPTLDPRYRAILRRSQEHVRKSGGHAVVIDGLLRRKVIPA